MKNKIRIFLMAIFLFVMFFTNSQEISAQTTEPLSIAGWFSAVWSDDVTGSIETIRYTLTDESGQTTFLLLDETLIQSIGGLRVVDRKYVSVRGFAATSTFKQNEPNAMKVTSISLVQSPNSNEASIDALPAVSGSKPWISIMCKFPDSSAEPKNLAYFQGMYANTKPGLDHYWQELSFNTVNVSGSSAVGWFVLPQPKSYYNPTNTLGGTNLNLLAADCTNVANPSVNFALYQSGGINMMFNIDFDNGYAWGGTQFMNLDGVSQVWRITWEPPWGYSDISVIAHEMGHGFGLPHSSGAYGSTYDNAWDVMSNDRYNCAAATDAAYGCMGQHTISYHKDFLGWIPAGQKYTAGGLNTITIDHLALASTANYRMAQIPIDGSSTHFYTVEVRQQSGYDVKVPGKAVVIHEVDTTRLRPAYVVDIDNNGFTYDGGAMWTVGETFTDTANGIFVEVLSATATGFQVKINNPIKPDLIVQSITPNPAHPMPGEAVSFNIIIKNQGSADSTNNWRLDIYLDDTFTGCGDYSSIYFSGVAISAGATQNFTYNLPAGFGSIGTHTATAFVDSGCQTDESNESNNILVKNIPVDLENNDSFAYANEVTLPYTDSMSTTSATTASDDPNISCVFNNVEKYNTVWYRYTPPSSQNVIIRTIGSNYDTVLAVWTGIQGDLTAEGCNDDYDFSGVHSQLQIPMIGGTTYYIEVASYYEGGGNLILDITNTSATFGDVPVSHPYWQDIEILYANGFTAGCSTSPLFFCPEETMNRGQSAVFILRGNFGPSYIPPNPPYVSAFSDDWSPGPWVQKWAQGMLQEGLTAGCSVSSLLFCPWEQMPRLQAAVFGMRLKEGNAYNPPAATGTVFADITDPSVWYAKWAEQAYLSGILPACGTLNGKPLFCPNDLVNRGLGAFMIVKAKNLIVQ